MALSNWLPFAIRTGLAYSNQADLEPFPNVNGANVVIDVDAAYMNDSSQALAVAVEGWDGTSVGDDQLPLWSHIAGDSWTGAPTRPTTKGGFPFYVRPMIPTPRPRFVRARIVATGSIRFRVRGELL